MTIGEVVLALDLDFRRIQFTPDLLPEAQRELVLPDDVKAVAVPAPAAEGP